jgi:hypothetical protein
MDRHARSPRWLGTLLSLCLMATGALARTDSAAAVRPAPMPETLSNRAALPFWVDADQVLKKNGQINSELLGHEATRDIERILSKPAQDGCIQAGEILIDRITINGKMIRRTSLAETFGSAAVAMRGRVTGRSVGFQGSFAGTLIRFEATTIYKDTSRPQRLYYTFMPVGRLKIGNRTICKTDPNYAEVPEVGDEIVLLQPEGYRSDDQYVDAYDGAGIITVKSDGRVSLPRAFSTTAARELASGTDLFARLQELMQEGPR